MSDTAGAGTSSTLNQVAQGASQLVDAAGAPIRARAEQAGNQAEQLTTFVREQPFAAVLVGVVVGYLLGKIT